MDVPSAYHHTRSNRWTYRVFLVNTRPTPRLQAVMEEDMIAAELLCLKGADLYALDSK